MSLLASRQTPKAMTRTHFVYTLTRQDDIRKVTIYIGNFSLSKPKRRTSFDCEVEEQGSDVFLTCLDVFLVRIGLTRVAILII